MISLLKAGLAALPDDAARRAFLGAAYTDLVGYDPFADDPTNTVESVTELLCSVYAEHVNYDRDTIES